MEAAALEALKYPIGRFVRPQEYDALAVSEALGLVESLPRKLLALASNLRGQDLDRRYRPGSWTVRQVINHIADGNTNVYLRFKFALTEDNPVVKPYLEDRWADVADAKSGDVRPALELLGGVQAKWIQCLRAMREPDFRRTFFHPDHKRNIPLYEALALYAWHGEHHLGHIHAAIENPAP